MKTSKIAIFIAITLVLALVTPIAAFADEKNFTAKRGDMTSSYTFSDSSEIKEGGTKTYSRDGISATVQVYQATVLNGSNIIIHMNETTTEFFVDSSTNKIFDHTDGNLYINDIETTDTAVTYKVLRTGNIQLYMCPKDSETPFAVIEINITEFAPSEPTAEREPIVTTPQSPETVAGFIDVLASAWYADDVKEIQALGLINGKTATTFDPLGNLTVAEAITIAAKIEAAKTAGTFTAGGSPWYENAVAYATEKNIIESGTFSDYNKTITRAEMAYIFARTLSDDGYAQIREASAPDTDNSLYKEEIDKLYKAGIVGGSDELGSFNPDTNITRAESAAIINRLYTTENRLK